MSRINNIVKNAKVGMFFMVLTLLLGIVSRRIFLDGLGPEFIGLNTTLINIIGLLAIADLGLSTAVSSSLYKPLAKKDFKYIIKILTLLGRLYKLIGFFILFIGLYLSLYLDAWFESSEVDIFIIYLTYWVLLITVSIEYIFNHKQIILSADQKQYVVTQFRDGLNLVKVSLQISLLWLGFGAISWLFVGVICSTISIFLINKSVSNTYPWLVSDNMRFKKLWQECHEVIKKLKEITFHKVASVINGAFGNVAIYKVSSLMMVALIGNYMLLSSLIQTVINTLKSGIISSVGNYVVENSKSESYRLFKIIGILHLFFGVTVSISFYFLVDGLIYFWLGNDYIIDNYLTLVISANLFIFIYRSYINTFIMAHGVFFDIYAPVIEVIINVSVSIFLGSIYGVSGVMVGAFVSNSLMSFIWKPYLLLKHVYGHDFLKYIVLFTVSSLLIIGYVYYLKVTFVVMNNFSSYYEYIYYFINMMFNILFFGLPIWGCLTFILFRDEISCVINRRNK